MIVIYFLFLKMFVKETHFLTPSRHNNNEIFYW